MKVIIGKEYQNLLVFILSILMSYSTAAQIDYSKYNYLFGMPSPQKVKKNYIGKDEMDTYARQIAAFKQLNKYIDEIEAYEPTDMNAANQLKQQYLSAAEQIESNFLARQASSEVKQAFEERIKYYSSDEREINNVANTLLSNSALSILVKKDEKLQRLNDNKKENKAFLAKSVNYLIILSGILALVFSININRQLKKYEFINTTDGGVVKFDSYEKSVAHYRKKHFNYYLFLLGFILILIGFIRLSMPY